MRARKREKYLRTRAILTPWQFEGCQRSDFSAAIVIPALAEFENLPRTLESLTQNSVKLLARTLVVVVVNQRVSSSAAEKADNAKTLDWLSNWSGSSLNVAWVDACCSERELKDNEGVGLARKIGFDLVLSRLDWDCDPLLISLDADTLVDKNYLSAIFATFREKSCAGATLPFRHQQGNSAAQEKAIRIYELYLRSYQLGLDWAGSPYAYTSIGSAFACRADSYVAAGGMKRRQAGEDFYFLQQLAKGAGVSSVEGTLVSPSPRLSSRVPFGTGPVMKAVIEDQTRLYRFISGSSFQILKAWLTLVAGHSRTPAVDLLDMAAAISIDLKNFLAAQDFLMIWDRLQNNFAPEQFMSGWNQWFDGLRTRQLLHCLEGSAGIQNFEQQVVELFTIAGYPAIASWPEQLRFLEQIQGVGSFTK